MLMGTGGSTRDLWRMVAQTYRKKGAPHAVDRARSKAQQLYPIRAVLKKMCVRGSGGSVTNCYKLFLSFFLDNLSYVNQRCKTQLSTD
jgi:hypothetical protein